MGDWYWIGVAVGLGVALGVLAAGILGLTPRLRLATPLVAALAGAALALAFWQWDEAIGGGLGGLAGALGAMQVARGTLRRGGTRGGTAALFLLGAAALAAIAFVPVLGYVEALAVPLFGVRQRRREPRRYAGLRTLAD